DTFMGFLDYIGMVLSALLGILIADYFFVRKGKYDVQAFEDRGGKYWYVKGVNIRAITVWAVGVIFFLAAQNTVFIGSTVGAVYPTIILTAVLYSLISIPARNKG